MTLPIWLTLIRAELAALRLIASAMMAGFVTSRSSPTIWMRSAEALGEAHPTVPVALGQAVLDAPDGEVA